MIDVAFVERATDAPGDDPARRCTFCRRDLVTLRRLVAGPGVSICDACIVRATSALQRAGVPGFRRWWHRWRAPAAEAKAQSAYRATEPRCSFCGELRPDVTIQAEHARICAPCVKLASEIVAEDAERGTRA